jgi:hypothetical protein
VRDTGEEDERGYRRMELVPGVLVRPLMDEFEPFVTSTHAPARNLTDDPPDMPTTPRRPRRGKGKPHVTDVKPPASHRLGTTDEAWDMFGGRQPIGGITLDTGEPYEKFSRARNVPAGGCAGRQLPVQLLLY